MINTKINQDDWEDAEERFDPETFSFSKSIKNSQNKPGYFNIKVTDKDDNTIYENGILCYTASELEYAKRFLQIKFNKDEASNDK